MLVERDQTLLGDTLEAAQTMTVGAGVAVDPAWTHAALYCGNGMVVEAIPGAGIVERSVWTYCATRRLQVRRLPRAHLPAAQAADAVRMARKRIGQGYSAKALANAALRGGTPDDLKAVYCSDFVALVIAGATGIQLWDAPSGQRPRIPLYPGVLAAPPDLVSVRLAWLSPAEQDVNGVRGAEQGASSA